ncbi:MAG TPA: hypothetical protein PKC49_14385, partial [Phycisphaerae bacterium]|nr:hypothetical protein [Phycisphaerae bacterium]
IEKTYRFTNFHETVGFVNALAVYDDGTGPALYAGGQFNEIDGMPIDSLARGGGKSWSPVGNPGLVPQAFVWQLRVVDDGTGQVLMMAAGKVQKWDGKTWTRYMPQPGPMITAAVFPGPDGPKTLHVGGEIPLNIGEPPQQIRVNIARFDGPTAGGAACGDFDGDGMVTQADLGILLAIRLHRQPRRLPRRHRQRRRRRSERPRHAAGALRAGVRVNGASSDSDWPVANGECIIIA